MTNTVKWFIDSRRSGGTPNSNEGHWVADSSINNKRPTGVSTPLTHPSPLAAFCGVCTSVTKTRTSPNGDRRCRVVLVSIVRVCDDKLLRFHRRPVRLCEQVRRTRWQNNTDRRLEKVGRQVHRFDGTTQPSRMSGIMLSDGPLRRIRVRRKSKSEMINIIIDKIFMVVKVNRGEVSGTLYSYYYPIIKC